MYNLVNLQLYHYAGNNPVKYVDPDGRLIMQDDMLGAMINGGLKDFWSRTVENCTQTWSFLCARLTTPGTWAELLVSASWAIILESILSPLGYGLLGLGIGFFTPMVNTFVGYLAIEFFNYRVSKGTTNNKNSWLAVVLCGSAGEDEDLAAFTLGTVILGNKEKVWNKEISSKYTTALINHEFGHTIQSFMLGPLYWLVVAPESFIYFKLHKLIHGHFIADIYYKFYTEK